MSVSLFHFIGGFVNAQDDCLKLSHNRRLTNLPASYRG